jgi:hypothetical protein
VTAPDGFRSLPVFSSVPQAVRAHAYAVQAVEAVTTIDASGSGIWVR